MKSHCARRTCRRPPYVCWSADVDLVATPCLITVNVVVIVRCSTHVRRRIRNSFSALLLGLLHTISCRIQFTAATVTVTVALHCILTGFQIFYTTGSTHTLSFVTAPASITKNNSIQLVKRLRSRT